MTFSVVLYQTPRGEKPVKELFDQLNDATYAKFFRLTSLLSQYGPNLAMPYSKKIQKNLYELRIKGVDEIRILYSFVNGQYVLLHAFKKKTNKTPIKEIETAVRRLTII